MSHWKMDVMLDSARWFQRERSRENQSLDSPPHQSLSVA
jgi:hypothetical protein